MSFLTTVLLCIMCFILSFRVTNQQRSLTDIMCMGKRYRRHNKIMAAGALEVIKTDSGHLALKVDTQGSKDFVAIRLSRKEAKHFKAVLAACDGEPLNVSVCQYKVGGKKYFILYDKNADKKVPIELNGPKEETVKSNCKTVRSAAFAIFIFSPLLHTISPAISIVMILTATILVLLNIPFLPNSEWEKMCEFIKRPQTVQQSSEVNTDIVQSAASIALQEIMDNLITITNTHAPEKLDLIVNVVWNDANNQDGYRPDTTTIHMSGTDGTQDTKDFTKDSSWSSIVFKDLDRFKDGTKIKYTVTEDEIPQYTTSIVANGNVVTVTNTHIPEITLRNISVIWEDNDDQDGIRPDAVNIKLKGNDKLVDSSELNEDVKWKHSFTNLPVRENGNEISYTAEENEIPGYTTTIEKTDTGYVFTNTHIPETVTVTVDKVWDDSENQDGLRPDTIHIKLVSNGIAKDAYLDADSNWHLEFDGLPKYRDHGILNEYSVQEVDVDGYTSTVTTEDGYAFTIKNDHVPAVIDIPITEEWIDDNNRDGLRPSSHTVILTDGINTIEEIVLDKDNGYGTVLKDMPKYKNGVEIDYQIKDFKVDGYTTNIIKGDSVKDFKVTNTHVPEMVTVTVTEGWHDQSDYDKIRPEEIALTLTGSDGNVYEKTVNKETWTAVFSDLPKNSKGEQIIYTLTQEGIKGYSTTITNNQTDTITVINKHEPVKAITVTVTWNDENNKDSIRPDKVTVKLTDGTTVVSTKEVKNDSWKHIFEDIPVFNGSDKVSYTITQDAVNGYTTEIKASDDGNTIEIINTHIPVVPPKEEPKKEEPATPAPVVEVKVEQPAPSVTLIQTTNKPTGISFFESLFAK